MLKLISRDDTPVWVNPSHVTSLMQTGQGEVSIGLAATADPLLVRGEAEDIARQILDGITAIALRVGRASVLGVTSAAEDAI